MPYCSVEEAWGNVSEVNYPNSNIYDGETNSIYEETPKQKPQKRETLSRSYNRQPQHSGPKSRISNHQPKVVKFGKNNKRYVTDMEDDSTEEFNYDNQEVPITKYDQQFFEDNSDIQSPVHVIKTKRHKKKLLKKRRPKVVEESDDSIDEIIRNDVEQSEVESVSDTESEQVDYNGRYKSLQDKYSGKNKIIKHLIAQNEKLRKLLDKHMGKSRVSGIFSVWDLLIVLILGVVMIFILDYVYKIAVQRS